MNEKNETVYQNQIEEIKEIIKVIRGRLISITIEGTPEDKEITTSRTTLEMELKYVIRELYNLNDSIVI